MENNMLNGKLKSRARELGLCDKWFSEWGTNESQQELIEKYKRGIDFCIKHSFPNNEFIKKNFDRSILNENLVFVDENIKMDGRSGVYVVNGNCNGEICIGGYAVATLYVRNTSNISIKCTGNANVFISTYDQSSIVVSSKDLSKVYVYKKNGNCKVTTYGDVKIRE